MWIRNVGFSGIWIGLINQNVIRKLCWLHNSSQKGLRKTHLHTFRANSDAFNVVDFPSSFPNWKSNFDLNLRVYHSMLQIFHSSCDSQCSINVRSSCTLPPPSFPFNWVSCCVYRILSRISKITHTHTPKLNIIIYGKKSICSIYIYIFVYIFHENYSLLHFTSRKLKKRRNRKCQRAQDVFVVYRYAMAYTTCCLLMRWTNWKRVKCVYDRYDGACECFFKMKQTHEKETGPSISNVNVIRVIFMLFHLIEPFNYHFTKRTDKCKGTKTVKQQQQQQRLIESFTLAIHASVFRKERPAVNVNSTEKKTKRRNEAKGSLACWYWFG